MIDAEDHALRVRTATAGDADRLIALINAAFSVETFLKGPRTDSARLAAAMNKGTMLLAEDGGGRLAASVYVELRGDRGYAGMLAVDPTRQKSGIGARMMRAAEDYLRRNNCSVVDITVLSLRPELPPLYRKLGFVETGTEPFRYPHPIEGGQECYCIVMSKPL